MKSKYLKYFYSLFLLLSIKSFAQNYLIKGNVSTDTEPVRYASVTFIDEYDSTRKYSTLTDTLGNYRLSIITKVEENKPVYPSSFELEQNYPNPFSTETAIIYKQNEPQNVYITIYNILGQEVKRFTIGVQDIGLHSITWNGTNNLGNKVSSGIYFYQMQSGKETMVKKMIFGRDINNLSVKSINNCINSSNDFYKKNSSNIEIEKFKIIIKNYNNTSPRIFTNIVTDVIVQKDTTLNFRVEEADNKYSLCYEKEDSTLLEDGTYRLNWEIYVNNMTGTNPRNISNYERDDEHPRWSPDGRYIAYTRRLKSDLVAIVIYDTKEQYEKIISPNIGTSNLEPEWTPNGKVYFGYRSSYYDPWATYLVNPDGSNPKKILDTLGYDIYFYNDSYTFIYRKETKIYRTNIDGTFNEFILDEDAPGDTFFTLRDFNPFIGDLLVNTNAIPGYSSAIATFNTETKQLNLIIGAEEPYRFMLQRYSKDYSKIIFIEENGSTHEEEYLTVFENGEKKRLVKLTGMYWHFDYNPMQFSYDSRYVAFSEYKIKDQFWYARNCYLYVIDIITGELFFIDNEGISPSWNPFP